MCRGSGVGSGGEGGWGGEVCEKRGGLGGEVCKRGGLGGELCGATEAPRASSLDVKRVVACMPVAWARVKVQVPVPDLPLKGPKSGWLGGG